MRVASKHAVSSTRVPSIPKKTLTTSYVRGALAFVAPIGYEEVRTTYPRLEGTLMMYIVQELEISGGAAKRLLESLKRDHSPTAFLFKCLHCDNMPVYVDHD